MAKFASSIIGLAASAALLVPLSVQPNAKANCKNPAYHFVMSGPGGTTVPDTTNAEGQFCAAVSKF